MIVLAAVLALTVPGPPGPYDWVCPYLDSAPTLFGVLGLGSEAAERGLLGPDTAQQITAAVADGCPVHSPLMDGISLVVGS